MNEPEICFARRISDWANWLGGLRGGKVSPLKFAHGHGQCLSRVPNIIITFIISRLASKDSRDIQIPQPNQWMVAQSGF